MFLYKDNSTDNHHQQPGHVSNPLNLPYVSDHSGIWLNILNTAHFDVLGTFHSGTILHLNSSHNEG